MSSGPERLVQAMADSVRLGYEVEADDPNMAHEARPDDEVQWPAGWLVREGLTPVASLAARRMLNVRHAA
jgi:hypothetical protein